MPLVRVRGRSMIPALRPGHFIWVGKRESLHRGQIVLIQIENTAYLKRIVGLPGERLEIRGGRVYINDQPLSEPYVPPTAYLEPKPDQTCRLPPSTFFVLGDARDDSLDSRQWGPVSVKDIVGVGRWRLWPPQLAL
jgi:signal peptidase I